MQVALIGLPWTGKSTLFNTMALYAGLTVRAQPAAVGRCVVPVPDRRLDRLNELFQPKKKTHTTIEVMDIPGLDARGSTGAGIPGNLLAEVKNATALIEVVGGFSPDAPDDAAARVAQWRADSQALADEMLVADLTIVESRRGRIAKQMKGPDRAQLASEYELLGRLEEALGNGQALRELEFTSNERTLLGGFQLLSQKPIMRLVNVTEDALHQAGTWLQERWGEPDVPLVCSAAIENEIAALPEADRAAFLVELEIQEEVLPRLIAASHALLGLITFFTAGDKEVRSWTLKRGTRAPGAAGAIHSDLERGFIRAEVVTFEELEAAGTFSGCRERGTLRVEGKDYVVEDGDVITVRFSV